MSPDLMKFQRDLLAELLRMAQQAQRERDRHRSVATNTRVLVLEEVVDVILKKTEAADASA